MVEDSRGRRQHVAAMEDEAFAERALEGFDIVVGMIVVLVLEEKLHLGIVAGDELEDQLARLSAEPVHQLRQRDVRSEREVMGQGEAQDQVGAAAFAEWFALAAAPAEA